jgi:hypothetical protein
MVTAALSAGFKALTGKSEAVVPGQEGSEAASAASPPPAGEEEEEDGPRGDRAQNRPTISAPPTSAAAAKAQQPTAALGDFGDEEEEGDAKGTQPRDQKDGLDSKKDMVSGGGRRTQPRTPPARAPPPRTCPGGP